jgi:hypothetical protein
MRDIQARQRNIVFPDTAQNEARFWLNAMDNKLRLGKVQVVGIGLMCLTVVGLLGVGVREKWKYECPSGTIFDRVVCSLSNWAVVLALCGMFFLFLRWRVRRALRSVEESKSSSPARR